MLSWHKKKTNNFSLFGNIKEVDINDAEISDIICYSDHVFTNIATMKASEYLKDVVRDKRFIVTDGTVNEQKGTRGTYVFYDKEKKALYIAIMKLIFKNGWKWEKWHQYKIKLEGSYLYKTLFPEFRKKIEDYPSFDICGQTPIKNLDNIKFAPQPQCPAGMKKAVLEFFGGCPAYTGQHIAMFNSMYELEDLINKNPFLHTRFILNGEEVEKEKIQDIPVPYQAIKRIKKYGLIKCLEKNTFVSRDYNVSILQTYNGTLYERVFKAACIYGRTLEETEVLIIEYMRNKIDEDIIMNDINRICQTAILLYANDLKGTILEYTGKYITEWTKDMDECFEGNIAQALKKFKEKISCYQNKYWITPDKSLYIAAKIQSNKLIELLCAINIEGIDQIRRNIMYDLTDINTMPEYMITSYLGPEIQPGTTITAMLGIPKSLLTLAIKNEWLEGIKFIRMAFYYSAGAQKYLQNMNEKDIEWLFKFFKNTAERYNTLIQDTTAQIFSNMIMFFGYKNWKGYIKQIKKLDDTITLKKYKEYIILIAAIRELAENAQWKIKKDDIDNRINAIKAIGFSMETCRQAMYDAMFKSQEEKWKVFCYEDSNFIIKYPKKSSELVREGLSLQNCVGQFIEAVSKGISTILFIRKKKDKDKPFYTLEIKNGAVRQCHGFGNKNVREVDGLTEFLRNFCEANNIKYQNGACLYGPNGI